MTTGKPRLYTTRTTKPKTACAYLHTRSSERFMHSDGQKIDTIFQKKIYDTPNKEVCKHSHTFPDQTNTRAIFRCAAGRNAPAGRTTSYAYITDEVVQTCPEYRLALKELQYAERDRGVQKHQQKERVLKK